MEDGIEKGVLGDEGDLAPQCPGARSRRTSMLSSEDSARILLLEPEDQVEYGRFPASRRPDDEKLLTRVYGKSGVAQDGAAFLYHRDPSKAMAPPVAAGSMPSLRLGLVS